MVVYFHRNPQTFEVFYVGIGKVKERAYDFRSRNPLWKRHVKKYGVPVVDVIIEDISKDHAQKIEIDYIKYYGRKNDGGILCNISTGGETGDRLINYLVSNPEKNPMFKEENKARLRGDNNPMRNAEAILKFSLSRKGIKLSEQARKNISIGAKNRKYTPEDRAKMAARITEINKRSINIERKRVQMTGNSYGKANAGKPNPNSRAAINMIDIETNNILLRFDGLVSAAKYLSVHPKGKGISNVLSGKSKTAYGYKWQYDTSS